MSISKDQRIKKLKKKHIWPSVLGLFLILFILSVVTALVLGVSSIDIIHRKMTDSCKDSVRIAELFTDYNSDTDETIEQTVLSHIAVLDEIEAVAVLGTDKNQVWSSNNQYPVIDETRKMDALPGITDEDVTVMFADEEDKAFSLEDGILVINERVFAERISKADRDSTVPFSRLNVWIIVPVNDMQVMVLNSVPVYFNDFIMMFISIALCAIMTTVFVIYYLISIIGMVLSMRKTTKIIYTDMLTGGDNWLLFIKKGTNLLKKNKKGQQMYAVLHLEMCKYRSFCTCFGVNKGQELIEKFHTQLKKEIHGKEVMAHQENAEFGLLLNYTDKAQLEERIQSILNKLSCVMPGIKVNFGVGVYLVQPGEYDIEQLYNNAMIACEMLGEDAENKTAFFDVEMNKQKLWERRVEDDMDRALQNKEFQVYLQPKINTSEEELGGAEALVRWIHPTEGFIPPNRFIPIFEKNGFILKLDDYMLEEIAKLQSEWLAQGRKLVPISVNVSRAHFTREDLAEHICAIVDKYNVPHNVIELELTESAFFDDKKVLLDTVQKLRSSGFHVSMDDFGAGYSSLNSLKELQIDVLKIDADFFRGADVEERGLLIVSEVIDLAKKLNMKIVAEGIESKEQVEFLTTQECDLIQGYYYAKPMPVAEFSQKYHT